MGRRVFTNDSIAIAPKKLADVCKEISDLRGKTPDLEREMNYILARCRYDAWNGHYQTRITITSKNEPLFGQIKEELEKEGFTVRAQGFTGPIYIRWDDGNWDYLDK